MTSENNKNKNISHAKQTLVPQEVCEVYLAKIKEIQEIDAKSTELLDAFYKEFRVNINTESLSEEIDVNFDNSEDAYLLAVADNLDLEQAAERRKNRKVHKLPATQGFVKLEDFAAQELEEQANNAENELNETIYTTAVVEEQITPKKCSKSIVEQILEDFCSSPQTPKTAALEESLSPLVQFQHKVGRTYSRQSRLDYSKRRNLTEELNSSTTPRNQEHYNDDDDCISTSSGLSVQEDLLHSDIVEEEIQHSEACVFNESEKLYENLLNLSVYFSQNSDLIAEQGVESDKGKKTELIIETNSSIDLVEEEKSKLESEISYDCNSQEIVELYRSNISQHLIDMQILSSKMSEEANEVLSEILNIRQKIPTDLLHLNKTVKIKKNEFLGFEEDIKLMEMRKENTISEEAELFGDDLKKNVKNEFLGFEEDTKLMEVRKENTISEEVQLFGDDDSDDFFLNFKTQDVIRGFNTASKKQIELSEELPEFPEPDHIASFNKLPCFTTASKKPIEVSEEAKQKSLNILAELQELPEPDHIPSFNKLPCFTTASKKPIKVSEEAKQKSLNILAELQELPEPDHIPSFNKLPCFTTASKKPIKVSEEAKQKSLNILAELQELPEPDHIPSFNKLPSFATASKKPIKVSKQAKQKALNILAELPELPENVAKVPSKELAKNYFNTASRKPIAVSAEAQAKAANILAEIPEVLQIDDVDVKFKETQSSKAAHEVKIKTEMENYADLQFSEWPYAESKQIEREPLPMLELENSTLNLIEIKKIDHNDSNDNSKELEASIGSTNSNLNISNRKLIARKNLLSLSKRRKYKNITHNSTPTEKPEIENKLVLENKADESLEDKTPCKSKIKEDISSNICMETPNATVTNKQQLKDLNRLTASTPLANANSSILKNDNTPETPANISLNRKSTQNRMSGSKKTEVVQRLERLAMYGEPPALSPIPQATPEMMNKVKRLGLSRRSKKKNK